MALPALGCGTGPQGNPQPCSHKVTSLVQTCILPDPHFKPSKHFLFLPTAHISQMLKGLTDFPQALGSPHQHLSFLYQFSFSPII